MDLRQEDDHSLKFLSPFPIHVSAGSWLKATDYELEEVKFFWEQQYEASRSQCLHSQLGFHCKNDGRCRVGCRFQEEHILCGNIIKLWTRLSKWLQTPQERAGNDGEIDYFPPAGGGDREAKRVLRLVRATTGNGVVLVGAKLPTDKLPIIRRNLRVGH